MEVSRSEESNQSLGNSDAPSKSNDSWSLGSNKGDLDTIKQKIKKTFRSF